MQRRYIKLIGCLMIIAVIFTLLISINVVYADRDATISHGINLDTEIVVNVDTDSEGNKYFVKKTIREYLKQKFGDRKNYFTGTDALYAWGIKYGNPQSEATTHTMKDGSTVEQRKGMNNINQAIGDGTKTVQLFCIAHNVFLNWDVPNLNLREYATKYANISDISENIFQGAVYEPKKKDVLNDTYEYNGNQTFQGLAYILESELKNVTDETLKDEIKQDAIWDTFYNKSNNGDAADGHDEPSPYTISTTFSRSNTTYPGETLERIVNALRSMQDSSPETEAIGSALDVVMDLNSVGVNIPAIDSSKYTKNCKVTEYRLFYASTTVGVEGKYGDWIDISSLNEEDYNKWIKIDDTHGIMLNDSWEQTKNIIIARCPTEGKEGCSDSSCEYHTLYKNTNYEKSSTKIDYKLELQGEQTINSFFTDSKNNIQDQDNGKSYVENIKEPINKIEEFLKNNKSDIQNVENVIKMLKSGNDETIYEIFGAESTIYQTFIDSFKNISENWPEECVSSKQTVNDLYTKWCVNYTGGKEDDKKGLIYYLHERTNLKEVQSWLNGKTSHYGMGTERTEHRYQLDDDIKGTLSKTISNMREVEKSYQQFMATAGGVGEVYPYLDTIKELSEKLGEAEKTGSIGALKNPTTEIYKAYIFLTDLSKELNKVKGTVTGATLLSIPESQLREIYNNIVKKINTYLGTPDAKGIDSSKLATKLNNALKEYYHSLNNKSIDLITNARQYVNEYYTKDPEGMEKESGINSANAKLLYNKNGSTYKYQAGPFTMNYFYYAMDTRSLEGEVDYLSAVEEMKLVGIKKDGTEKDIAIFDNKGNANNAEIIIDKSKRDASSFDYTYPFPKGDIDSEGTSYIDEEFYFKFNLEEDDEIEYVTVRAKISYLKHFEGYFYECKDIIPIYYKGQDSSGKPILAVTGDSITGVPNEVNEVQALLAYPEHSIKRVPGEYTIEAKLPKETTKNPPEWGFEILKVDANNHDKTLEGAEFKIEVDKSTEKSVRKPDDTTFTKHIKTYNNRSTSHSNGKTSVMSGFTETGWIRIKITETKAPDNYKKDTSEQIIYFYVSDTGSIPGSGMFLETNGSNLVKDMFAVSKLRGKDFTVGVSGGKVMSQDILQIVIENKQEGTPPSSPPGGPGNSSYTIDLSKYDSVTNQKVTGAEFAFDFFKGHISSTGEETSANTIDKNKYVISQSNGFVSIVPPKEVDMTDYKTEITLKITEIKAPNGYNKLEHPIYVQYTTTGNDYLRIDTTKGVNIVTDNKINDKNIIDAANITSNSYSIKIAVPNEPKGGLSTKMQLGGTVYVNTAQAKGDAAGDLSDINYDYGEGVYGAKVILKKNSDNTVVETKISDIHGNYIFDNLSPKEKYYVEFIYDGVKYEDVYEESITTEIKDNITNNWAISSKAKEAKEDREALINRFKEIRSWPNNYVTERTATGYNQVYTKAETNKMLEQVTENIVGYMKQNNAKYPTEENVIYSTLNDSQKVYLLDRQITASTNELGVGPFAMYNKIVIDKKYSYDANGKLHVDNGYYYDDDGEAHEISADKCVVYDDTTREYKLVDKTDTTGYHAVYPQQLQINMGLKLRPDTDLAIMSKKLVNINMSVNGKTENYIYEGGNIAKYLELRSADTHIDEKLIDVYLTYGIEIKNQGAIETRVTELVDYYSTCKDTNKVRYNISDVSIVGDTNTIITFGDSSKYTETDAQQSVKDRTAGYIKFKEIDEEGNEKGKTIPTGKSIIVKVTLKLTDEGKEELKTITKEEETDIYTNNLVEINGYQTEIGVLDEDSIPGNVTDRGQLDNGNLTNKAEDDAKEAAPVVFTYHEPRTLSGSVWEAIDHNSDLKDYVEENGIKGIGVELIELKTNAVAKVWSETSNKWEDAKTNTGERNGQKNGEYSFAGYLPGDYVIRFIYGDKKYESNGVENKYYTAEDYQSIKANPDINKAKYWYADFELDADKVKYVYDSNGVPTHKKERYSDAYDDVNERIEEIAYFYEEESEKPTKGYSYEKGNLVNQPVDYTGGDDQKAKDALTMKAYTSVLELEVEYINKEVAGASGSKRVYEYSVQNVDFGIGKRPKTDLRINKTIKDITIISSEGEVISDHETVQQVRDRLAPFAQITPDGDIYYTIDDERLHGATLTVRYEIEVQNNSDANTIKYFKDEGGNKVALAYYGEGIDVSIYNHGNTNNILYYNKDDNKYVTRTYKNEEDVEVKTAAMDVIDYIQPNYTFSQEIDDNKKWETVTVDDLKDKLQNGRDLSKYTTIVRATTFGNGDGNPITQLLSAGAKETSTITLTKLLTPTEDLNFENIVEIATVGNRAGRVDHEATPGNYEEDILGMPKEHDEAKTKQIVITDPTGEDQSNFTMFVILASISIFALGIVLIKKFVISKNINNNNE